MALKIFGGRIFTGFLGFFMYMAYVYKHIRLDKNQVFYVGIGEGKNYARSKNSTKRNKVWKRIANKTEYIIEIAHDNISYDEAFKIEQELINFYGRLDLGTGSLANLTNGGEGSPGIIRPNGYKRPEHSMRMKNNQYSKGKNLGDKNPMRRKEVSEKISKAKLGISRPKLICPHCGKEGGTGNMQRWHFNNCRNKLS